MPPLKTDTIIVGAGQAGLAMSEHLSNAGVAHIVFERNRIAERWRSERWDSLVANGPAWHDCFPSFAFEDTDPDAFVPKEQVADYFESFARHIAAPVRTGVEVTLVEPLKGRPGYHVQTTDGNFEALRVVCATGPFQRPVIPDVVPETSNVVQLHSSAYRNPAQIAEGGVLVVGAGSSGVQIAEELMRAGKKVFLSVGPHDRPFRTYRGRDFVWWLGVLGKWNLQALATGTDHVTIAVSGARGGHTVDFRALAAQGMILLGRTEACADGILTFASDLAHNVARGDRYYLSLMDEADAYIRDNGLDLPAEPGARIIGPDPDCMIHPLRALNLMDENIKTIIWATGFRADFDWLKVNAFDANGKPDHQRGVGRATGIYFLGLPWLSRRGSSFIWGVWHDAKYIADDIVIQQQYHNYRSAELPVKPDA
ncbi:MAG: NAD(P)/FAD-dependent oxidoreductase [Pseudorhodobacter sp.]